LLLFLLVEKLQLQFLRILVLSGRKEGKRKGKEKKIQFQPRHIPQRRCESNKKTLPRRQFLREFK